jgi:predicted Rossmann fold flavoprotein
MMCAGTAAAQGMTAAVLEGNSRPGRKLMITGKGRCNLTNLCDPEDFLLAVRRNPRFLYSAIHALTPRDTMAFFETLGVGLKVERGNRVFPRSDRAVDVVDALARYVRASGAEFIHDTVLKVNRDSGGLFAVTAAGRTLRGGAVVVATGGLSYPATGSTGDGYRFAEALGHRVVPPAPSLVPIVAKESWCGELAGLALKNVTLSVRAADGGKVVFSELGEMLFTHFGLSGPLVLSASSHIEEAPSRYRIAIDLKPGLTPPQLDARLLRDFSAAQNRNFSNALEALLPRSLIPVIVKLSGIPRRKKSTRSPKNSGRHCWRC